MKDNQAFVITVQTELGQCYLGERDSIMTKPSGAVFYHDEMYAKSELNRVISTYSYTENTFLNDKSKLSIKLVEINIL